MIEKCSREVLGRFAGMMGQQLAQDVAQSLDGLVCVQGEICRRLTAKERSPDATFQATTFCFRDCALFGHRPINPLISRLARELGVVIKFARNPELVFAGLKLDRFVGVVIAQMHQRCRIF